MGGAVTSTRPNNLLPIARRSQRRPSTTLPEVGDRVAATGGGSNTRQWSFSARATVTREAWQAPNAASQSLPLRKIHRRSMTLRRLDLLGWGDVQTHLGDRQFRDVQTSPLGRRRCARPEALNATRFVKTRSLAAEPNCTEAAAPDAPGRAITLAAPSVATLRITPLTRIGTEPHCGISPHWLGHPPSRRSNEVVNCTGATR
jgi:hypothetical protein